VDLMALLGLCVFVALIFFVLNLPTRIGVR
jgi:hypothetical protein